jgi:hypothetical protein
MSLTLEERAKKLFVFGWATPQEVVSVLRAVRAEALESCNRIVAAIRQLAAGERGKNK